MAKYGQTKYSDSWGSKGSYFDKDVGVKIVPAPVGGWDALSPLAAMEPKYAASIVNWVAGRGWIEVRGGYNAWAQGLSTAPSKSLMCYRAPNATIGSQKGF